MINQWMKWVWMAFAKIFRQNQRGTGQTPGFEQSRDLLVVNTKPQTSNPRWSKFEITIQTHFVENVWGQIAVA